MMKDHCEVNLVYETAKFIDLYQHYGSTLVLKCIAKYENDLVNMMKV